MFKISIFLKKVENKMNKKIKVILLLSIISTKLFSSNLEVEACKIGLKDRNGAIGISLLNGTEETGPCAAYAESKCLKATDPIACRRRRAACIFGYNSNLSFWSTGSGGSSKESIRSNWGNMGDLKTLCCYKQNSADRNWFDSGQNQVNVINICDYGFSIGWGLNPGKSNENNLGRFNYYDTYQKPWNTDNWTSDFPILDVLWGKGASLLNKVNLPNHAQLIRLEIRDIQNALSMDGGGFANGRRGVKGNIDIMSAINRLNTNQGY